MNIKNKKIYEDKEKNDNLNIKSKAELTTFVNNQYSKYLIINVKNGETRLEEIFNFFKSEEEFNNRKIKTKNWPKFILEAIDKNKKQMSYFKDWSRSSIFQNFTKTQNAYLSQPHSNKKIQNFVFTF